MDGFDESVGTAATLFAGVCFGLKQRLSAWICASRLLYPELQRFPTAAERTAGMRALEAMNRTAESPGRILLGYFGLSVADVVVAPLLALVLRHA